MKTNKFKNMRRGMASLLFVIFYLFNSTIYAYEWHKTTLPPYISKVTNTSIGLLAGEFDTRATYNGLYLSQDTGETWTQFGLASRGITDIAEFNGIIYVTTYYAVDGYSGLFRSNDNGITWEHIGPNVSATFVAVDEYAVYLGAFSHGLWISNDNGQTFNQKIGKGFFGPNIKSITVTPQVTLAATGGTTYASYNHGIKWTEVSPLTTKTIKFGTYLDGVIYLGTQNLDGIYVSSDLGMSWTKLNNFGTVAIEGLSSDNNLIYASKFNRSDGTFSVYESQDQGNTWLDIGPSLQGIESFGNGIGWTFDGQTAIYMVIAGNGVYIAKKPKYQPARFGFLDNLWPVSYAAELTDKITSYFDHQYPLLGYNYYTEPDHANTTTVNFWGQEAAIPQMYYSNHSGTDFALPYGTPIYAPSSGRASYFYCNDCGHSIKIDHKNGYQTVYQHLQKEDLITFGSNLPIEKGTKLGKVGLSGKTTGPHLHFEVMFDQNNNGSFTDDFPQGRVDPFGWLTDSKIDPWPKFTWQDNIGNHTGSASSYLWLSDILQKEIFLPNSTMVNTINLDNKSISVSEQQPINVRLTAYSKPVLTPQENYTYIPNTSFLLNIISSKKELLTNLKSPVSIAIQLTADNLTNVLPQSLKIYYFDEVIKMWTALDTIVDLTAKVLTAHTNHLSWFAAFGQQADTLPPITDLEIIGVQDNLGWYTTAPTIKINSQSSDIENIFYSLDKGASWEQYITAFTIEKEGIVSLLYKATDITANMEKPHEQILKINSLNVKTKKVSLKGANFSM